MYPLIKAIDRWTKSKDKHIVKDIDIEYGVANRYFFGNTPSHDVFSKNYTQKVYSCKDCGKDTTSPTHLCYDCWFKRGSPAHINPDKFSKNYMHYLEGSCESCDKPFKKRDRKYKVYSSVTGKMETVCHKCALKTYGIT